MLTSRAEYRLLLRNDNADIRLRKYGHNIGLISDEKYQKFEEKLNNINDLTNYLRSHKVVTNEIELFSKLNTTPLNDGLTLYDFIKRPEVTIDKLIELGKIPNTFDEKVIEQVEINIKYEGYIRKAKMEVYKMRELENTLIPNDINYDDVINIASEARQKLKEVSPISLGQASRISGVNPSDIAVLSVYLKKEKNRNDE